MQIIYNNNKDVEYLSFWMGIVKKQLNLKDQQYELLYNMQKKSIRNQDDKFNRKRRQSVIDYKLDKTQKVLSKDNLKLLKINEEFKKEKKNDSGVKNPLAAML